ncbi:hypothetical protein HK405_004489 [Cladochytrium tenue]|nr:hypothetical protein HK405_004489 [Cladochytrium tenue]
MTTPSAATPESMPASLPSHVALTSAPPLAHPPSAPAAPTAASPPLTLTASPLGSRSAPVARPAGDAFASDATPIFTAAKAAASSTHTSAAHTGLRMDPASPEQQPAGAATGVRSTQRLELRTSPWVDGAKPPPATLVPSSATTTNIFSPRPDFVREDALVVADAAPDVVGDIMRNLLKLSGDLNKPVFAGPLLISSPELIDQRGSSEHHPALTRVAALISKHIPSPAKQSALPSTGGPQPTSVDTHRRLGLGVDFKPVATGSSDINVLLALAQISSIILHPLLVREEYRIAIEREVESVVVDWFKRIFGIWTLKCVHFNGSVDFSGGRLVLNEIQVVQTDILDPTALSSMMSEDVAMGRRPCIVVARAGAAISGQCDPLEKIREISSQSQQKAANDPMDDPAGRSLAAARSADSLAVDLGAWLGLADSSVLCPVTLFLTVDPRRSDPIVAAAPKAPPMERSTSFNASVPLPTGLLSSTSFLGVPSIARTPSQPPPAPQLAPRPVPLTFSLPWWLLVGDVDAADDAVANAKDTRRGGISLRFVQARELARTLSRKVALSRTLHCPTPADLTYLTCCVRFSPSATSVGKEIQRTLSGGFDAASRLPPAITQASPRLGPVAAADRAMQARYRELADVGTRKIFELIPDDLKSGLGLCLVQLAGYSYIRYRPVAVATSIEAQSNHLLALAAALATRSECVESALRMQVSLPDIVRSLAQRSPGSTPTTASAALSSPPVASPAATAAPTAAGTASGGGSSAPGLGPEIWAVSPAAAVVSVSSAAEAWSVVAAASRQDSVPRRSSGASDPAVSSSVVGVPPLPPMSQSRAASLTTTGDAASTSGVGVGGVGGAWLGLGAVQFCPAYIDPRSEELEAGLVRELDELNAALVARLRDEQHSGTGGGAGRGHAFSLGVVVPRPTPAAVDADGPAAAARRTAGDTLPYTEERVRELLDMVVKQGRELERSEKLSILRSLPVIGTVLGVLGVPMPRAKDTAVAAAAEASVAVYGSSDEAAQLWFEGGAAGRADVEGNGGGNRSRAGSVSQAAQGATPGAGDGGEPASPRTSMSSATSARSATSSVAAAVRAAGGLVGMDGVGSGGSVPRAAGLVAHAFTLSGGLAAVPVVPLTKSRTARPALAGTAAVAATVGREALATGNGSPLASAPAAAASGTEVPELPSPSSS